MNHFIQNCRDIAPIVDSPMSPSPPDRYLPITNCPNNATEGSSSVSKHAVDEMGRWVMGYVSSAMGLVYVTRRPQKSLEQNEFSTQGRSCALRTLARKCTRFSQKTNQKFHKKPEPLERWISLKKLDTVMQFRSKKIERSQRSQRVSDFCYDHWDSSWRYYTFFLKFRES